MPGSPGVLSSRAWQTEQFWLFGVVWMFAAEIAEGTPVIEAIWP
jgi:hypothetical protein